MVGDGDKGLRSIRPSLKSPALFNNYSRWKHELRENCFKRVREDRTRLLWKLRVPEAKDQSANREDLIKSTFQDIVSNELKKLKGSSLDESSAQMLGTAAEDMIWEYNGLHTAYQGDCEEILLEMQRIFYEDLRMEDTGTEPDKTWEDEEDEYLARLVYEHMQLNSKQVGEELWCPICKQGKLQENGHNIYCSQCPLKLERGNEVDLNLLRMRLGEAHIEHLDRGCRLRPEFCVESKFGLSALYIKCQGCNAFDIVL